MEVGAGMDNQMGEIGRRKRREGMHKGTVKIKDHLMDVWKPNTVDTS